MNFLLLFLVVARRVELEDVASRACELLGYLPSNCPAGHRTLVWRGQLSLLLLFQVVVLGQKCGQVEEHRLLSSPDIYCCCWYNMLLKNT